MCRHGIISAHPEASENSLDCLWLLFRLAYWELYIYAAALIVHVFPRLSLSDTSAKDVQYDHDELIGKPYVNSKGVRVLVSSKWN